MLFVYCELERYLQRTLTKNNISNKVIGKVPLFSSFFFFFFFFLSFFLISLVKFFKLFFSIETLLKEKKLFINNEVWNQINISKMFKLWHNTNIITQIVQIFQFLMLHPYWTNQNVLHWLKYYLSRLVLDYLDWSTKISNDIGCFWTIAFQKCI